MEIRSFSTESFADQGLGPLLEIPQPPKRLWLRGALAPRGTKTLVVVGSRALTPYGRQACEKLIAGLAGYPISILSGLAFGADACAHRAALAAGLHTVAIPGSGLDDRAIAPSTNLGLARRILDEGGALLSEHPPATVARPEFFPSRNRIMVGLADAVLVIEAAEKSGTLITARLAAEYSRDLLCVPHRMGDVHGFASSLFIRLGAGLVTDSRHILDALGIPERVENAPRPLPYLNPSETVLYALLATPLSRDEAIRQSGLPAGEALTALLTLELKGLAREEFGAWKRR